MHAVVGQCRRILKPSGPAVFILQPNSRKVGSMRLWLWEFLVWAGREWNIVQDAWWWNETALPEAHAIQGKLMRPSIKACVWLGYPDCYRDQDSVLMPSSDETNRRRKSVRSLAYHANYPSGHHVRAVTAYMTSERRGGVIPFNVIRCRNVTAKASNEAVNHPAMTPEPLVDFWLRYLCPPGGTACDPFLGSGTTALAALRRGLKFVGGDKESSYIQTTRTRLAAERARTPLLA